MASCCCSRSCFSWVLPWYITRKTELRSMWTKPEDSQSSELKRHVHLAGSRVLYIQATCVVDGKGLDTAKAKRRSSLVLPSPSA
eukprot:3504743-Amphidinium_carterae.1